MLLENFEDTMNKLEWHTLLSLVGLFFLVLLWIFQLASFETGIYGLLFLSCAGILYLSITDPAHALLAGIFAIPLITIQYKLPVLGQILSFDRLFLVSFSLIWLFRSLLKGSIRHSFHVPNLSVAWLFTLAMLGVSFAIGWTQEGRYLIHAKALLEPLFIALFFFASFDVMRNDLELPSKMIQVLLISAAIVLLGSAAQLTVEAFGVTPPRLALLFEEGSFPFSPHFSTIAHPNFMAGYTVFAIALGLGSIVDTPSKSWFLPLWIITAGMLVIYSAKSLGGLFLLLTVTVTAWSLKRRSVLNVTSSTAYVRWIAIFGVCIVFGSTLVWGIPKIRGSTSFNVRAYPYKVVLPEIQAHPFFGSGPGSYSKIFQQNELKIPLDERPTNRRLFTKDKLRSYVRASNNGVTLVPGSKAIWLEYELNNTSLTRGSEKERSLLEGVVAKVRVRASQPKVGRFYIKFGDTIRESASNMENGSQILFVASPLSLRGIPGWKVTPQSFRQSIKWVSDAEYSNYPALSIQKTPFEMTLKLDQFLKIPNNPAHKSTLTVGAWVKRKKSVSRKYQENTILRLINYHPKFGHPVVISAVTKTYVTDGDWRFIVSRKDPDSTQKKFPDELFFTNETIEEEPLLIGGIFLDNGKNIFSLLPGFNRPPPIVFSKRKPILSASFHIEPVNASQLKFKKLVVGMVAEPGRGPVHFDQLELDFPKGRYLFSSIWKDLRNEIERPIRVGYLLPPWYFRIEGWSNIVSPSLSAHSVFLVAVVEGGLLGLLSIFFLYGVALWKIKKRGRNFLIRNSYIVLALSTLLLSSITEDTLLILRFSILFWVLSATALASVREMPNNSRAS